MPGEEHHEFTVTIPAGTPKTAPVTISTVLPQRIIRAIQWVIPPGPSGLAGWRITMGGVQVIPANAGAWIVRDGIADGSDLARLPTTGAWDVTGYNTGTHPHSLYVTFYVDVIRPVPRRFVPFGLDELQAALDQPMAHRPRGE
jgi:hypothetical protein